MYLELEGENGGEFLDLQFAQGDLSISYVSRRAHTDPLPPPHFEQS
jgi:hypothetical protein